jgi:hypothetical protein
MEFKASEFRFKGDDRLDAADLRDTVWGFVGCLSEYTKKAFIGFFSSELDGSVTVIFTLTDEVKDLNG